MNTKTHGLRCIVTAVPSFIRLSTALSILVLLTAGRTNAQFVAVPLPDPKIPGFQFPEAESTIVDWVFQASNKTPSGPQSFAKIHLHGWGIWTALTMETDQVFDGQKLRTFETWPTPQDVMAAPPNAKGAALMLTAPRSRSSFQPFHQFGHVKGTKGRVNPLRAAALINPDQTITGFVKYDPSAASHIVQQGLLSKKNLGALLQAGANAIPSFPVTAFALQPVFDPSAEIRSQVVIISSRFGQGHRTRRKSGHQRNGKGGFGLTFKEGVRARAKSTLPERMMEVHERTQRPIQFQALSTLE